MSVMTLGDRLAMPNPRHLPAVVIFHPKGRPPAAVLGLFALNVPLRVIADRTAWTRTDLVVQTSALTAARERLAARLGAPLCLLPEQSEYISGFIDGRRGEPARLGGTDYAMGHQHGDQPRPGDVHLLCAYAGMELTR